MSKTILYFCHHGLGDVIMKIPSLRILGNRFSLSAIIITVQHNYIREFLHAYLDIPICNIYILNKKKIQVSEKISFFFRLLYSKIDFFVLSPTINYKLGYLLFLLSNAKYLITSRNPTCQHKLLIHIELIRKISGAEKGSIFYEAKKNYFLDRIKITTNLKLRTVLVHIGSGEIENHKRLPLIYFKEILIFIIQNKLAEQIILIGGEQEVELNSRLLYQIPEDTLLYCKNLAGKLSIHQLIDLMTDKNSLCLISNDSGPAHLMDILGKKVIAFFGPTNPKITGPFLNQTNLIFSKLKKKCIPCYGSKEFGIYGCKSHLCMKSIGPEEIKQKVLAVLS